MPHVLSNTTSKRRRLLTLLLSVVVALAGVILAPAAGAAPPQNAPDVFYITPGDGRIDLGLYSVLATPPVERYEVSVTTSESDIDWQPFDAVDDGNFVTGTISGLQNGTPYYVRSRAINADGISPSSAVSIVTPDGPPAAPTIGTATASTDGRASVTFTPPPDNGNSAVVGYSAVSDPGFVSGTCTDTACSFEGLANGTSYTFTVSAINGGGQGPASEPSNAVIPRGKPYAPRSPLRVGATPQSATVSFFPPIFSGLAVTGYQVSSDNGATWRSASTRVSGARRLLTATTLRPGVRYAIRVRGVNALGVGASSAAVVILTAPATVVARPAARAGTSASLVTWRASTQLDVFGYLVVSNRGARCYTYARTETRCIIGNTAGIRTFYRVYARSSAGTSFASAASNTVRSSSPYVPSRVPGVPGGFAYRSTKVKSGKTATLTARGFLPSSSVVLVAYGAKRHIVKRFVTTLTGSFIAKFVMPKDKARTLTFVAFGSTPYGSSKAIGTTIRRG